MSHSAHRWLPNGSGRDSYIFRNPVDWSGHHHETKSPLYEPSHKFEEKMKEIRRKSMSPAPQTRTPSPSAQLYDRFTTGASLRASSQARQRPGTGMNYHRSSGTNTPELSRTIPHPRSASAQRGSRGQSPVSGSPAATGVLGQSTRSRTSSRNSGWDHDPFTTSPGSSWKRPVVSPVAHQVRDLLTRATPFAVPPLHGPPPRLRTEGADCYIVGYTGHIPGRQFSAGVSNLRYAELSLRPYAVSALEISAKEVREAGRRSFAPRNAD